jgi:hypothetical protein
LGAPLAVNLAVAALKLVHWKASQSTRQLEIDPAALTKIISDILGSEQGLANIFSKEKGAGLYDSTVSADASGELTAKLVGEIAKLTAKEVSGSVGTTDATKTSTSSSKTSSGSGGILGSIGGIVGGLFG